MCASSLSTRFTSCSFVVPEQPTAAAAGGQTAAAAEGSGRSRHRQRQQPSTVHTAIRCSALTLHDHACEWRSDNHASLRWPLSSVVCPFLFFFFSQLRMSLMNMVSPRGVAMVAALWSSHSCCAEEGGEEGVTVTVTALHCCLLAVGSLSRSLSHWLNRLNPPNQPDPHQSHSSSSRRAAGATGCITRTRVLIRARAIRIHTHSRSQHWGAAPLCAPLSAAPIRVLPDLPDLHQPGDWRFANIERCTRPTRHHDSATASALTGRRRAALHRGGVAAADRACRPGRPWRLGSSP